MDAIFQFDDQIMVDPYDCKDNTELSDPAWTVMMQELELMTSPPQQGLVSEQDTSSSDDSGHDPRPLARGRAIPQPLRLQPQAQLSYMTGGRPLPLLDSSSVSASPFNMNPDVIQPVFSPFLSPPDSASASFYYHRSGSVASHSSSGDIDPMEVLRLGSSGTPSSASYSDSPFYTAPSSANQSPAPWPEQGPCESPLADINSEEHWFDSQATERRRSRSASPRRDGRNPVRRRSNSSPPKGRQTGVPLVEDQLASTIKGWRMYPGDAPAPSHATACVQCRSAKTKCERDGNADCVRCTNKKIKCEQGVDRRKKEYRTTRHQN